MNTLKQAGGISLLIAASLLFGAPAFAADVDDPSLYRRGEAPVIERSADDKEDAEKDDEADTKAIESAFQKAYKKQKSPRIGIYWNKELSDELADWASDFRIVSKTSVDGSGHFGDTSMGMDLDKTDTREVQYKSKSAERRQLREVLAAEFESAMTKRLLKNGVRLIDRAMILRLTSASGQQMSDVEIEALKAKTDYLAELAYIPSGSYQGFSIKITVKKVDTGEIVTYEFLDLDEAVREGKTKWVATDDGYEQRTEKQSVTLSMAGDASAVSLMESMTVSMSR